MDSRARSRTACRATVRAIRTPADGRGPTTGAARRRPAKSRGLRPSRGARDRSSLISSHLVADDIGYEVAVGVVGEQCRGLRRRNPTRLVDLVVRFPFTLFDGRHTPVTNPLVAAFAVGVRRRRQLAPEFTPPPRLLFDFAARGVLMRLSGFELALRKAPIVVARAVHHEHFHAVGAVAYDDPARRFDPSRVHSQARRD